jgi:hypothetical protein
MRTGGLLGIARLFLADRIRSLGIHAASACQSIADAIEGRPPKRIEPPREWQPRLWERDHDPRTEQRERRP